MSESTNNWSEEKIRRIIHKLDEKTGLNGATLPITFETRKKHSGFYAPFKRVFGFNKAFFDNPNTEEAEVIDTIRHEYAHYCVGEMENIMGVYERDSHGSNWRRACNLVGANPTLSVSSNNQMKWSKEEVEVAINADDIEDFDITSYVEKWKQLPVVPSSGERFLSFIKESNPNAYYEEGDEVLHTKRGFGTVLEAIPYDFETQKIHVLFEDGTEGVFVAKEICKMVNGRAVPFRSVCN